MCYVIENFQPMFTHLRYYPYLRVLFFFRNLYKHFILVSLFFNNLVFTYWPQTSLNFFNNFFIKNFTLVIAPHLQIKSNPIKLNFPNSLQFWALTRSLFLYTQYEQLTVNPVVTNTININFEYQYYLTKKVLHVQTKKTPFKIIMLTILKWIINPWTYFNTNLKLVPIPLSFTPQMLFLKYINTYFFKVYNF